MPVALTQMRKQEHYAKSAKEKRDKAASWRTEAKKKDQSPPGVVLKSSREGLTTVYNVWYIDSIYLGNSALSV